MCVMGLGNLNTCDPRKRESHLSIDEIGGGFCTLNTSLGCHNITTCNYPFSILIRVVYR